MTVFYNPFVAAIVLTILGIAAIVVADMIYNRVSISYFWRTVKGDKLGAVFCLVVLYSISYLICACALNLFAFIHALP